MAHLLRLLLHLQGMLTSWPTNQTHDWLIILADWENCQINKCRLDGKRIYIPRMGRSWDKIDLCNEVNANKDFYLGVDFVGGADDCTGKFWSAEVRERVRAREVMGEEGGGIKKWFARGSKDGDEKGRGK
ncbi:hypothetical protein GLAREA_02475 [Glarea lozoyensis ATCC 20868]|uniref:Uncharacterized protein n=1 Tax=Glarea lozoyensis (strain ATCC 20868 / MF5171) TaxID=1116229 RepID=S3CJ69_GLAL2|nr:uncharacterized protein GLAREA_02475 [Glarea lozoyensis ATCC 20868]EPE26562.1 hypothetical protein GLAREA_02475 [Glarea lozoyensis ATCC 20868]